MRELVEFMAKSLVEHPEAVEVKEVDTAHTIVYELHVAQEDMGRVIGKEGRVADAMRTILRVAGLRQGKRIILEIV